MAENKRVRLICFWCFLLLLLFILGKTNFLLFHSLVELFTVIMSIIIFIIVFYSHDRSQNQLLIFLGLAYGFVGVIDLFHVLAYKGMGVFPGATINLPTQLWVIARYLESIWLLIAILSTGRQGGINYRKTFLLMALTSIILLGLVTFGLFPVCYVTGSGLTFFKVMSEFIISILFIISLILLRAEKKHFTLKIYKLLSASIIFTILSETAFALYLDVYGFSNLLGHLFKLISFYLIFKAIIETGIKKPYELLYFKLNQQKKLTQSSLDSLSAPIAVLDQDYIISYTNQAWKDFFASNVFDQKGNKGSNYLELCRKITDDGDTLSNEMAEGISQVKDGERNLFSLEYPCHSADKQTWFNIRVTPFTGEKPYAVVVSHENITGFKLKEKELEEEKEKNQYLSFHDGLTSLYNRRFFEKELERLNQSRRLPISIIVADLDNLKKVNDTYGHQMGDQYIIQAGEVFAANIRKEDIVARIGGDEFAVILPETGARTSKKVCRRIENSCRLCNTRKDLPVTLRISLGFATATSASQNLKTIFEEADRNMYRDKH